MFKHRTTPVRTCLTLSLAGLIVTAIFSGCGRDQGPERVVVSGKVTFNGKPLDEGQIRFVPTATSAVPVSGASIKDGQYKVDSRGGVPVGMHKIEIEAHRVDPKAVKPGLPPPPMARGVPRIQYIPKRYNVDSQLQLTIEPGSKPITKDFELTE
jgi:hypothetical protein